MNIEKRIKSLQPYVIQIRFVEGVGIVDVIFKKGWKVPESKIINSVKGDDKEINYYMFYTDKDDLGLDDVLDYIEEVMNINIEREKKYELLKVKTEELKDVFRNNSLSSLENMKFVLGSDKLIPDNMPEDFDDMSIIDEVVKVETSKKVENEIIEKENNTIDNTNKVYKNQEIELPPKKEKIELTEYSEPKIICNCVGDDVCPVCIEEKVSM